MKAATRRRVAPLRVEVPAIPTSWSELEEGARAFLFKARRRRTESRLIICLDELFTNTIRHGHVPGRENKIVMVLSLQPAGLTVSWEDDCDAFDPMDWLTRHRKTLEQAPEGEGGGRGLVLIEGLSHDLRYAYEGGFNRLSFEISLRP